MLKVIFLVFFLTNFSSILGGCFDLVALTVFRGDQKIIYDRGDTVNYENEATEIIVQNQRLPLLHTGCFKNLTKLEYITVTECGLRDIEKSALLELPKLRAIYVTFNNIIVIPNGVFHSLDLVKLSLIGNGIKEIEQRAFYNLTSLQILDLSRNNLHSLKLGIFFKTNNLRQINLSNNRLLFIHDSFFWDCFSPVESYDSLIDLSYNKISEIRGNTFKGVYYIDSLLLNDNNIKKINPNAFHGVIQGKTLDLRDNILKKVPNKKLFRQFEEVLYDEERSKFNFDKNKPLIMGLILHVS